MEWRCHSLLSYCRQSLSLGLVGLDTFRAPLLFLFIFCFVCSPGYLLLHRQWCHQAESPWCFLLNYCPQPFSLGFCLDLSLSEPISSAFHSFSFPFHSFLSCFSLCAFSSSIFSGVSVKILVFTFFLIFLGLLAVPFGKGKYDFWRHKTNMGTRTTFIN